MEEIDDVLETSAREHAHLRGFSQADREFYVQLEDSDWAFRRSRYQAAMQRDRELGQWLALQWQLYDQAIQALSLAVKTYQGQPRKQVDVRIHVRRCRHGCVCCPHRRLAFFRGGEMLEIPCQTIALRAAGVRTNASLLVSAQRDLMACEDEIRSYYRTVEGFMDRALQRLLIMDRELAAIEYPYYPTPYICPRASGPYTPLPYLLATRFSDWLDDAQMSLSFALLRYATLFVRTKFNRVKQGFFGIHLQKRNSIFSPLYGQFRVYFRGNHGDWFLPTRVSTREQKPIPTRWLLSR